MKDIQVILHMGYIEIRKGKQSIHVSNELLWEMFEALHIQAEEISLVKGIRKASNVE